MTKGKRCKKQYTGETKRTLRERFSEHRQATNNPSHANTSAAVPAHFNLPDHSIEDMTLIPLEFQPTAQYLTQESRGGLNLNFQIQDSPRGMSHLALYLFLDGHST